MTDGEERVLGRLAVARGLVTDEQLDECISARKAELTRGEPGTPLGLLLLRQGFLSEGQLEELLAGVWEALDCGGQATVAETPRPPNGKCAAEERTVEDAAGFALAGKTTSARSNTVLGHYQLLAELGRGSMAVVYKAWDPRLKRIVALKELIVTDPDREQSVRRFMQGAQAAAKLRHPAIVSAYDVGEADGRHYLAMEYVEGRNLADAIREALARSPAGEPATDGLTPRQAAAWMKTIADAVGHAHRQGVVHRDLKPANVLVDGDGRLHVADFGLARDVACDEAAMRLTRDGQVMGTPAYMSPEQASGRAGEVGPACDVFSLGVMLYELLSGELPFRGEGLGELLLAIATADPMPLRAAIPGGRSPHAPQRVDADLETICLKCLERDPARRYRDAAELAGDLTRWLEDQPILARPAGAIERMSRKVRRGRAIVAGAGAGLLAFLGLLLAQGLGGEGGPRAIQRTPDAAAAPAAPGREGQAEKTEQEERRRQAANLLADVKALLEDVDRKRWQTPISTREAMLAPLWPILEAADRADRDSSLAAYYRGKALWLAGRDREAEESLRQSIERRPDCADAHFMMADILLSRYRARLAGCLAVAIGAGGDDTIVLSREELEGRDLELGALGKRTRQEFSAAVAGTGSDLTPGQVLYARGMESYLQGRHSPAVDLLTEALKPAPDFFEALLGRADVHLRGLGDFAPAIADYREATSRISVGRGPPLRELGWSYYGAKGYDLACETFTRGLDAGDAPGRADFLACRGIVRAARGELPEAIAEYTEALALKPRWAEVLYLRGAAHELAGERDRADADLTEALGLAPHHVGALARRGAVRCALGDLDGAIRDCTEALKLQPELAYAYRGRGLARRQKGELGAAIADFTEALTFAPGFAGTHVERAVARLENADLDGVIADCDAAVALDPREAAAYANRALAWQAKGDLERALRDADEALRWNANDPDLYLNRAAIHHDRDDSDAAMADYTELLRRVPDHGLAYLRRGEFRHAVGDLDGAIRDYTEAIQRDAGSADAFVDRARAHQARNDVDEAIADFTRALDLDPRLPEVHDDRARALYLKRAVGDAIDGWQKALELAPPDWPRRKQVEESLARARREVGAGK